MIKILFLLIALPLLWYWALGGFARYYKGPISDHFDGIRFFNPGFDDDKKASDIAKWRREAQRAIWPVAVENKPYAKPVARVEGDAMRVTFIGHATYLIQTAGMNILTDPFFSERASPWQFMGPKRVRKPGITLEDLPKIDLILVSHNHYDHLDTRALQKIWKRDHPRIVTPLGNDAIIGNGTGIRNIDTLDWGQSIDAGAAHISLEQAYHWSARGLYDRKKALWGAFIIRTAGGQIYFAGDTGYRDGRIFKEAGMKYVAFRLALLPIGAYEPRWFMADSHMDPTEAVEAHQSLHSAFSLGMHYGTVQLTDEGIDAPVAELEAALDQKNIRRESFIAPDIGEVINVP